MLIWVLPIDKIIITQTFTMARWQIVFKTSEATKQRPKWHQKTNKQNKKQNKTKTTTTKREEGAGVVVVVVVVVVFPHRWVLPSRLKFCATCSFVPHTNVLIHRGVFCTREKKEEEEEEERALFQSGYFSKSSMTHWRYYKTSKRTYSTLAFPSHV